MLKLLWIFVLSAGLSGCAAYGPAFGYGVGYSHQDLADGSVKVTYRGDTNISKDATVKYWLYRCAELTTKRGFTYFAQVSLSDAPQSKADELRYDLTPGEAQRLARAGGDPAFVAVRGGVPIITFIPTGGGGTYWRKAAVIRFLRTRAGLTQENQLALHAPTVLERLKPLVDTGKEDATPSLRELVIEAMRAGQVVDSPVFRRL